MVRVSQPELQNRACAVDPNPRASGDLAIPLLHGDISDSARILAQVFVASSLYIRLHCVWLLQLTPDRNDTVSSVQAIRASMMSRWVYPPAQLPCPL